MSIGELSDYWTADVTPEEIERIEAHVFACAACTELLAEADQLRRSIGDVARAGGFLAFITDSLLNQLAQDGVRVRSYVMEAGGSVQCAVWDEDEVLVTRLRGNFSGVATVDAVIRLDSGEEWGRASGIPLPEGSREMITALPAELVRRAPEVPLRLSIRSSSASPGEAPLAEYTFDHRGAHAAASRRRTRLLFSLVGDPLKHTAAGDAKRTANEVERRKAVHERQVRLQIAQDPDVNVTGLSAKHSFPSASRAKIFRPLRRILVGRFVTVADIRPLCLRAIGNDRTKPVRERLRERATDVWMQASRRDP